MDRGAWWATVYGVSKSPIQGSMHALGRLTSPTVAVAVSQQTIISGPPGPQETQASGPTPSCRTPVPIQDFTYTFHAGLRLLEHFRLHPWVRAPPCWDYVLFTSLCAFSLPHRGFPRSVKMNR